MNGAEQLATLMPHLVSLVDGLEDTHLDLPTPCVAFTVTGVLEHMTGGATAFAPAFRGEDGAPDAATGDLRTRWRAAMGELVAAATSPGAAERMLQTPFGPLDGDSFARYVVFDGLMHGWDLSVATGLPFGPDADVIEQTDAFARGLISDAMRDGDTFAAQTEAPAGADALDRLAAFSGRSVPA